jgi:YjbR
MRFLTRSATETIAGTGGGSFDRSGSSWKVEVTDYADVPAEIVARLRSVCLGLPEAYEERAWVGTRWRVRKRTFAHVLMVDMGWPPAYARAAGADGPMAVLMFRSSGGELDVLRGAGRPFFGPDWRADEVGMVLDPGVDWEEVAELVVESYCLLAPKTLAALVDRPTD